MVAKNACKLYGVEKKAIQKSLLNESQVRTVQKPDMLFCLWHRSQQYTAKVRHQCKERRLFTFLRSSDLLSFRQRLNHNEQNQFPCTLIFFLRVFSKTFLRLSRIMYNLKQKLISLDESALKDSTN